MNKIFLLDRRRWILYGLGTIALVVAVVALGAIASGNRAQAAPLESPSASPVEPDGGPFACTISNIAVLDQRIHVHCTTAVSGTSISYFAANGDSAHALTTNRFLVLLNTAYSLGKRVYIYYLDNPANNPPGCNTGDCRAISWMFIVP